MVLNTREFDLGMRTKTGVLRRDVVMIVVWSNVNTIYQDVMLSDVEDVVDKLSVVRVNTIRKICSLNVPWEIIR